MLVCTLDVGNRNAPWAHLGEKAALGYVVGAMAEMQYVFTDILMNSHIVYPKLGRLTFNNFMLIFFETWDPLKVRETSFLHTGTLCWICRVVLAPRGLLFSWITLIEYSAPQTACASVFISFVAMPRKCSTLALLALFSTECPFLQFVSHVLKTRMFTLMDKEQLFSNLIFSLHNDTWL